MDETKTFLITGVSSGLGTAFARAALAAGHRVVGTVRKAPDIATFEALHAANAHGVLLDVSDFAAIPAAVARAEELAGPIDVLVNNAGYGQEGALEESSLDDLRRQFDVNVYAPVELIRAVLPGMRARRSGHIVNITSLAGTIGIPAISYYCGSKFALEGISEALGKELAPFGIFVTALAPGQFRTDFAGRSMDRAPRSIADYDPIVDPIRVARQDKSGHQPGDPDKAAQVLLTLVAAKNPPPRLFIGPDALAVASQKIKRIQAEIAAWDEVSRSTNFD